jgi:hypothetical protein
MLKIVSTGSETVVRQLPVNFPEVSAHAQISRLAADEFYGLVLHTFEVGDMPQCGPYPDGYRMMARRNQEIGAAVDRQFGALHPVDDDGRDRIEKAQPRLALDDDSRHP